MKKSGVTDRRKSPRIIIEGNFTVLLTMESPGGSSTHFKIYPWDISRAGLGFFHRAFVYPGTKCSYVGLTAAGQPFSVKGEVVRCTHVSGNVHAIGTKLETEVDPDVLLGPNSGDGISVAPAATEEWWSHLASMAGELARLAGEKASTEAVKKHLARLNQHASAVASHGTKHPPSEVEHAKAA
jgi:hypothetical protein